MKKSIIIYADCIAILEELTYEQAGRLFKAILSYVNDEPVTETEGDPAIKMAFKVLKTQIDRDADKYERICEKRREYGRLGGLKKAESTKSKQKPADATKSKQNLANLADSENDSDSDSEVTTVTDNTIAPNGALSSADDLHINFEGLVNFFNSILKKYNSVICQIRDIKGKRRDAVRARSRERGKKSLAIVFENAAKSDFLNGKNDRGFIASFDWLLRPNNFIKVLEGNYDNPVKTGSKPKPQVSIYAEAAEQKNVRLAEQKRVLLSLHEAAQGGDARAKKLMDGKLQAIISESKQGDSRGLEAKSIVESLRESGILKFYGYN